MAVELSIVLPVFNAGRFLSRALRSVLPEVVDDVELVIVDDGSTDGSTDILADVAGHHLVRVVRQANAGLPAALRTGIALARGPVVARMDADDINVPGRISAARCVLDARPDVGLVSFWADVIDETDRVVGQLNVPWLADDVQRHLSFVGNNVVHGAAVFRRDVYEAAGGYRDGVAAEDYDLWLRMTGIADLQIVPETLYRYRLHSASITGRTNDAVVAAGRSLMDPQWSRPQSLHIPGLAEGRRRHQWYVRAKGPAAGTAFFNSLRALAGEARLRGKHAAMTKCIAVLAAMDPARAGHDVLRRLVPAS